MRTLKRQRNATLAAAISTVLLAASSAAVHAAEGELAEVVVTGSYIKGPATDAPSPVSVISRDSFDQEGVGTMSDIVKNLTINSGSTTAPGTDGSNSDSAAGTANINLRGLGQNATLVLFNGKRQVSAAQLMTDGSEFVDINGLPMIAVERLEVLSDGGSALYGSDAIAGVVNYVLRTDFQGLELRGDATHIDKSGSTYDKTFGGLWGWKSGGGNTHFVVGGEYFDRDPIPITAAANYNQNKVPFQMVGVGSAFIPLGGTAINTAFLNPSANFGITDPQCYAQGFRTGYTSDPTGRPSAQCWQDVSDNTFLDFGQRRYNLIANLSHEFSSAATLSVMARYAHDDIMRTDTGAANGLAPVYMMPVINAGDPLTAGIPTVGSTGLGSQAAFAGHAVPTITNAPITTANGGLNVPELVTFITHFPRPDGGGGDHRKNTSDTKALSIDLKGDMGSTSLSYDVSLGYSSNERLREDRVLSRDRMELALNGLGGPSCVPNGRTDFDFSRAGSYWAGLSSVYFGNYAPGYPKGSRQNMSLALTSSNQGVGDCHFLNPYLTAVTNPALGNSEELLDWVAPVVPVTHKKNELYVFDAVVTGDMFDVPGGTAKFAAGVQARRQRNQSFSYSMVEPGLQYITGYDANGVPNAYEYGSDDLSFGAYYSRSFDDTRNVKSVFTELSVPILPKVETQLAVRYEDYGDIGGELSPKFAVSWRPVDSLLLRGSYTRSFRAPNVGLIYNGTNSGAATYMDPLKNQAVRAGLLPPTAANAVLDTSIFYTGVGSPNLKSEHATTYSLGFIFTPKALDGFSAQVDYWRFEYKDKIVAEPFVQALQDEMNAFVAAAADHSKYVTVQSLLSTAAVQYVPCNPDALTGTARANCVVDPRAYEVPSVFRQGTANQAADVGDLINVLRGNVNAGTITTDGVDVKLGYSWDMSFGRFLAGVDYSYVHQYTISDLPGFELGLLNTGIFDAAGTSGDGGATARALPDHRGNVSLTWSQGPHRATVIERVIGAYKYLPYDSIIAASTGSAATISPALAAAASSTIPAYRTTDVSYTYSGTFGASATNFSVTAAVLDVFEASVPYVNTVGGAAGSGFQYDGTVYDDRGRRFKLTAVVRF